MNRKRQRRTVLMLKSQKGQAQDAQERLFGAVVRMLVPKNIADHACGMAQTPLARRFPWKQRR